MKETRSVVIKSSTNGISLLLDPDLPIDQVILDICRRFHDNRSFFGRTTLVLSLQGRKLSAEEMEAVVEAIEYNSDVRISYIDMRDGLKDRKLLKETRALKMDRILNHALIHPGSVKNKEEVIEEGSVLIIGDVAKGAYVRSGGNIIVTGLLEGDCEAGAPSTNDCFIYAGRILTEHPVIGENEGDLPKAGGLFSRHHKGMTGEVLLFIHDHFCIVSVKDETFIRYQEGRTNGLS